MAKLILNSRGLNTKIGSRQLKRGLDMVTDGKSRELSIFVVSVPEYDLSYDLNSKIKENCENILGLSEDNIRFSGNRIPDYTYEPDIIYVTEGNSFVVLRYMQRWGIINYVRTMFSEKKSGIYLGSSAGALIAGTDIDLIATDFDGSDGKYGMYDFTGLKLFDGTIIPHYTQEYREQYIANSDERDIRRYSNIYSVSNDEILIMDTESDSVITVSTEEE